MDTSRRQPTSSCDLVNGTRVALISAAGTWPAGSVGTVIGPSGPALGRFDVIVEFDVGGRLFFRAEELRALPLATSAGSSRP